MFSGMAVDELAVYRPAPRRSAEAHVFDSRVNATGEHGVCVTDRAILRLDRCRVRGAQLSGLRIEARGDAAVHECIIEGASVGIYVDTLHHPLLLECTVSEANETGVHVAAGTSALIRGCRISRIGGPALLLDARSAATVEDCDITEVGGSGVVIWTGAAPVIRGTTISHCKKNGLYAATDAHPRLTECELSFTDYPAIYVGAGAAPVLSRCLIHDAAEDVTLEEGARPTFDDCHSNGVRMAMLPGGQRLQVKSRGGATVPSTVESVDPPKASLAELLAQLDQLIGLRRAKQDVGILVKLMLMVKRRQDMGLLPPPLSRHLVFAGNPGPVRRRSPGSTGRSWPHSACSPAVTWSRWIAASS